MPGIGSDDAAGCSPGLVHHMSTVVRDGTLKRMDKLMHDLMEGKSLADLVFVLC